jgi:hypothetical protein
MMNIIPIGKLFFRINYLNQRLDQQLVT